MSEEQGICDRLESPHAKDMHAGTDAGCERWHKCGRMQFDGSMKSYDDIWRWMAEVGNTHQQAGEVIFSGGNPPTMRFPSLSSEHAKPGDWIVMHSRHDFRVERSEAIALAAAQSVVGDLEGALRTVLANFNVAKKRAAERNDAVGTQWMNVEHVVTAALASLPTEESA